MLVPFTGPEKPESYAHPCGQQGGMGLMEEEDGETSGLKKQKQNRLFASQFP